MSGSGTYTGAILAAGPGSRLGPFGETVPFRYGRLRFLYFWLNSLMPFSGPDGTFEYSMFHANEAAPRTPLPGGSAGRGPLCTLALHRFGRDPAIAAGPFITMLIYMVGIAIYLWFVNWLT